VFDISVRITLVCKNSLYDPFQAEHFRSLSSCLMFVAERDVPDAVRVCVLCRLKKLISVSPDFNNSVLMKQVHPLLVHYTSVELQK